jgi:hypothetical protein
MTLSPNWRTRIAAIIAAIGAVWLGDNIAQQQLGLSSLLIAALAIYVVIEFQPLSIGDLLLGTVVVGYVIGNRGFAQLSITPNLPFLPAEIVLVVAGGAMLVRAALEHQLPLRRDMLNIAVLLWMTVSSARLYFDVRLHGVVAVRDYAMVYYAAFFFLAQDATRSVATQNFLRHCLVWSCASLLVIYPLFLRYPDLFLFTLSIRGTPVIFFKGDLAGIFMAVGAVLFYSIWERRRTWWALALCLLLTGSTLATNNRASMVGLCVATILLGLAGHWRFGALQGITGLFAALVILLVAHLQNQSWHRTPLYGIAERVMSLVDPLGQRSYSAADAFNKGDNNRFRAVWWRIVYEDTMAAHPIIGLGYGYDLADRFVREYYPDGDEFTTRSPHNFLLTVFARTGLVGLAPFLVIVALIIRRSVRPARRDLSSGVLWSATAAILVSACFGVVLEGPMGAVVFWITLGMAAGGSRSPATVEIPTQVTKPALQEALGAT